jgi:hypothetical protein
MLKNDTQPLKGNVIRKLVLHIDSEWGTHSEKALIVFIAGTDMSQQRGKHKEVSREAQVHHLEHEAGVRHPDVGESRRVTQECKSSSITTHHTTISPQIATKTATPH